VKSNLLLHIFLGIVTFFTMTFQEASLVVFFNPELAPEIFFRELPYSIALMVILFSHEMGHYLPAKFHGVRSTLPYFIPMPFGPVGTMGAVIKIQDAIPDKKKLFDIGVGGPLMSFILSIPCWVVGLYLSRVEEIPTVSPDFILVFGDSLFTHWTSYWIHGAMEPGMDVMIHPLARAGWVGLLITAINLLPFGQLDGGHIIYAINGEKYRKWIYHLFLGFLFLGLVNFAWVIWGFLIYFLIRVEHPFVPDGPGSLDKGRLALGWFMLISLFFIFIPIPLVTLREVNTTRLYEDIINSIMRFF
jgi:membrane-associated protease RseP (regulator of RpoE activity)